MEVSELLEVSEVLRVIRCVLLCMLEGLEGELCLLEVLEVIRCVLLCSLGVAGGVAGDTLCATLYAGGTGEYVLFAGGCRGWALIAGGCGGVGGTGGVGGDALCAILYAGGCGGYALFMEASEVLEASEALEVYAMCYSVRWRAWRGGLFAGADGGVGGAGGDALFATLYAAGRGGGLCSLEVMEVMRCMLIRMLDAVAGDRSFVVPLWQFSRYGPPLWNATHLALHCPGKLYATAERFWESSTGDGNDFHSSVRIPTNTWPAAAEHCSLVALRH